MLLVTPDKGIELIEKCLFLHDLQAPGKRKTPVSRRVDSGFER
jgi:hypothetical protein